jgi:integrase/recombinase XerD
MSDIAPHVSAFLREHLPKDRGASPNTCETYSYAFQLWFKFAGERLGHKPCELQLEQLDVPLVLDFLRHLESDRGNCASTRNARLAAIKSLMGFIQHRVPAALEQVQSILAIPSKKTDKRIIRHLDADEVHAILDAPDPATRLGIRDRGMIHLAVTAGLRVSELVALKVENLTFRDNYVDVRVMGKGRRERFVTLSKPIADSLRSWLAVRGSSTVPEIFPNARGDSMTRSGFAYVLNKHVGKASTGQPSLLQKRVSPHVLRHTCAINTLQATGDIRKVSLWLGHASQQTTEVYLEADPMTRLEIADATLPPGLRPGVFSPPDRLIAMLSGVTHSGNSSAGEVCGAR